jgi:hypothetical protein
VYIQIFLVHAVYAGNEVMMVKVFGIVSFIFVGLCILSVLPGAAATPSGIGGNVFSGDYAIEDFQSSLPWRWVSPAMVQAPGGSTVYISDLDVLTEYVRITNTGWNPVVMTGWRLTNKDASNTIRFIEWTNPDGSTFNYELRGHSTVTIYSPREGNPTSSSLYWPEEMWYDQGDTAYLYDNTGTLVSTYSSAGTGPTTVPTTAPTQVPTTASPGTLLVTSTPGGAMVILDGVFRGITPASITGVSPGTHQLTMHRTGYTDYSASVTVLAGQTVPVTATLVPSSGPTTVPTTVPTTTPTQVPTGTGTLSITSSPTGAQVVLDFSFIGNTPLTVPNVPAGEHRISIRKSMYRYYSTRVMVNPGETTTVSVTLHHIWEGINPFS